MVKETHKKGSYLFGFAALPILDSSFLIGYDFIYKLILILVYLYFSYIGSLFPDIDLKNSYISKSHPKVYKVFGAKFKHRGFTHSLLFLYLLFYLSNILIKATHNNIAFICVFLGFLVGYISHLFLDLITKEGIELFYPISINFSILPIKTSSKSEKFICKVINFTSVFLLGYRFYILI